MEYFLENRSIIGLTEDIIIYGRKIKHVKARIDTGATKSSMDESLAKELILGPSIKNAVIKSASGQTTRPVVKAEVSIGGKKVSTEFTLISRAHMKYKVLIGRNVLSKGFLIDPSKRGDDEKEVDV